MTKAEIRAWLLDYAWLGSADEQSREVECIMAQDGWQWLAERAEQYAGAQFDPGPAAIDEGTQWALSALYEAHDEPHAAGCPRNHD